MWHVGLTMNSRLFVSFEILQILIIVQRVISDGVVLLGGCVQYIGTFVCETWQVDTILLRVQGLNMPNNGGK